MAKKFQKMPEEYIWVIQEDLPSVFDVSGRLIAEYNEEMKNRLLDFQKPAAEPQPHAIQLKVSTASCVRRIKLEDTCTLDDLHYYIQKSVDFGMDHLYYFQIGGGSRQRRYYAPQCEDERYPADEFTLAELHLYEGMHFQYLFDFGDEWLFQITVEKILHEGRPDTEIIIVSG